VSRLPEAAAQEQSVSWTAERQVLDTFCKAAFGIDMVTGSPLWDSNAQATYEFTELEAYNEAAVGGWLSTNPRWRTLTCQEQAYGACETGLENARSRPTSLPGNISDHLLLSRVLGDL
jgi:hypothetical protein